jgi:hypothetical protein
MTIATRRAPSGSDRGILVALPEYPAMKPLEITDRVAVESYTKTLPMSSDHNFTSLWMWNIDEETRLARAGANLVIELQDYATREPRLTLIGQDDVSGAAMRVLAHGAQQLDLIPDFVARYLAQSHFVVEHDRDQDDYVADVDLLATFHGPTLRKHRQHANQCARNLGSRLTAVSEIAEPQTALLELFDRWVVTHNKDVEVAALERRAVERLAEAWDALGVIAFGLYDDTRLIAAQVHELLPDGAIAHYQKADASYRGAFPLLRRLHCQKLASLDVRQLNLEQDLGIAGLRMSKTRYRPIRFVRKYCVRLRADHATPSEA